MEMLPKRFKILFDATWSTIYCQSHWLDVWIETCKSISENKTWSFHQHLLEKWNGKSKKGYDIALILHFQTCLHYLQSCVSTNPKSEHFSGSVSRLRGPTRQSPTSSGQTGLRPGWEFLVHSTKKWTDVALRLVSHLSWQICRLWKLFLEARHHWTALKVSVWVTSARLR